MIECGLPVLAGSEAFRGCHGEQMLGRAAPFRGRCLRPLIAGGNVIGLVGQKALAQGELGLGRTSAGGTAKPLAAALGLARVQKAEPKADLRGHVAGRCPGLVVPGRRHGLPPRVARSFAQR